MADFETQEEGGLIDRIKESPRTVSALIIILIVAAAIYAFSGEENQINGEAGSEAATTEKVADREAAGNSQQETLDTTGEQAGVSDGAKTADDAKREGATKGATSPQAPNSPTPLPEPQRTTSSFIEVAEAGNGITHLARKASSRWLSENQAGYAVTDEHRIYIEDYIQNKLGSRGLELGETMEIGFDLIQEAVAAAGELNESELRGLSQYTGVLK